MGAGVASTEPNVPTASQHKWLFTHRPAGVAVEPFDFGDSSFPQLEENWVFWEPHEFLLFPSESICVKVVKTVLINNILTCISFVVKCIKNSCNVHTSHSDTKKKKEKEKNDDRRLISFCTWFLEDCTEVMLNLVWNATGKMLIKMLNTAAWLCRKLYVFFYF